MLSLSDGADGGWLGNNGQWNGTGGVGSDAGSWKTIDTLARWKHTDWGSINTILRVVIGLKKKYLERRGNGSSCQVVYEK